jgi:outer membrane cobalamin receptor
MQSSLSGRYLRHLLLHGLGTCCVASAALAQQPPAAAPETVQEVVVTGSRILQSVAQSTQPLSIISADSCHEPQRTRSRR